MYFNNCVDCRYSLNSAGFSFMIRALQCQCSPVHCRIVIGARREKPRCWVAAGGRTAAGDCRHAAADVSSGLEAAGPQLAAMRPQLTPGGAHTGTDMEDGDQEAASVEEVTEDVEGSILNFFLGCFKRELSSSEPVIKDGRLYGQNYEEIMVTHLSKYLFQCISIHLNAFHLAGAVSS